MITRISSRTWFARFAYCCELPSFLPIVMIATVEGAIHSFFCYRQSPRGWRAPKKKRKKIEKNRTSVSTARKSHFTV